MRETFNVLVGVIGLTSASALAEAGPEPLLILALVSSAIWLGYQALLEYQKNGGFR